MTIVINKIFPLLLTIALGWISKKKGILGKEASGVIGKILFWFVVPALLLNAFATLTLSEELIMLPVAGFLTAGFFLIFGYIVSKRLPWDKKTQQSFVLAFPSFEGGSITYTLLFVTFGTEGLLRGVLFDFGLGLWLTTVIYAIAKSYATKDLEAGWKKTVTAGLLQLVKSPIIWGIVAGLTMNLLDLKWVSLTDTADAIGGSIIFLAMLMIGLELEFSKDLLRPITTTILLKSGMGLALGLVMSKIFGFTGLERIAAIVAASAPPSFLTLIYAKESNLDTKFLASLISIALPVAIVVLSILIGILQ